MISEKYNLMVCSWWPDQLDREREITWPPGTSRIAEASVGVFFFWRIEEGRTVGRRAVRAFAGQPVRADTGASSRCRLDRRYGGLRACPSGSAA
jgi:hypothetical protein